MRHTRTKVCDGVLRLGVCRLEPRPEIAATYDGLAGISQRPILRDILDWLAQKGAAELAEFLEAMRKRRSGRVFVYFADYVSYGVGGGDATAEYYFGSLLMLHYPAAGGAPEHLALHRRDGIERRAIEPVSPPPGEFKTPDDAPPVEVAGGE